MTVEKLINDLEKLNPKWAVVIASENDSVFDNIAIEQIKAAPEGYYKGEPKFYREDNTGEEVVLIRSTQ